MGILSKLSDKLYEAERKSAEKRRVDAKLSRHYHAKETIQKMYGVDISTLNDRSKRDLKKRLQQPILQTIKTEFNRLKKDPKLLMKIRADATREYGVDKELLSDIKPSMWIFRYDLYDDSVELIDASQEVTSIAGDYIIDDIIKVLESKFKDLVDGGVVKFGFGDGDEGIITFEMDW